MSLSILLVLLMDGLLVLLLSSRSCGRIVRKKNIPYYRKIIGGIYMLEYIIYAWFVIGVPVIGLYALGTAAHNLYADWINKGVKNRKH